MKKLLIPLFALAAVGCEVLEEDISGTQVQIIAPADRVSVEVGTVDFRWAAVEYATGYEFTVVSPSFSAAGCVVADTVIYADTLRPQLRLPPGTRRGRIRMVRHGI